MTFRIALAALAGLALAASCATVDEAPAPQDPGATDATRAANQAFAEGLPWDDLNEAELAERGFLATRDDPVIRAPDGRIVLDLSAFDFAEGTAPDTVNPSLWRHIGLMRRHGLYEVVPGIWQVRGFDLSVMTIIASDTGYILVDPLTGIEQAESALKLVYEHLGEKPVHAVIYTHSHADHFGGVKGVVHQEDVDAGLVQIIAPEGFMEHAVSENLIAGPAMSRRAVYQFGTSLQPSPMGQAGAGIGTGIPAGTLSLIAPTHIISSTGETMSIDGIEFEFQMTPGAEAPAEMNFYLPQFRALCLAENANATMHNILPPRGALVRDAKMWADYLTESIRLYADRTDVMFVSHGWPRLGQAEIAEYMAFHRDAYKYLHDQTVRLMNKGYTAPEIAEIIALPEALATKWYNRGYYGTMSHNSKAVYQHYLGWYDGNPVNLNPWPPEESARRYVSAMGGPASALRTASTSFDEGDYRWSAQVASHIVFADPSNEVARELLARSLEQLGYQAEGSLWRNIYLTGAAEARVTPQAGGPSTMTPDMIAAITTEQVFDMLAVRVDPEKATGLNLSLVFHFPDRAETRTVTLRNSVLVHEEGITRTPDASISLPRPAFLGILFAGQSADSLAERGLLVIEGDRESAAAFLGALDAAASGPPFPIVTP